MAEKGLSRFVPQAVRNLWTPPVFDPLRGVTDPAKKELKSGNPIPIQSFVLPLQLARLRQDINMWRAGVVEAEHPYFPHRVRIQQLFQDTILNGHVSACMEKRKNLTVLKEFMICSDKEVEDLKLTAMFKKQWFTNVIHYILDAKFYGYSLVNFVDIENDQFKEVKILRRANVSPDRRNLAPYFYGIYGIDFMEGEYADWTLYIETPSDIGVSRCGYGLLYKVAPYEIFCRNILGQNANFVEIYGQPLRVLRTNKKEGAERDAAEAAVRDMGSSAYAILDPEDQFEFIESSKAGTGWQSFANFEERCEKKISKLILGHADAMDSVPGKIGSQQGGEENPIQKSLGEVQSADRSFLEAVVNDQLIPKMRNLGFKIPEGMFFRIKNDDEKQELKDREDKSNKAVADIFQVIKNAGGKPDWAYFTERTGIKVTDAPPAEPPANNFPPNLQEKLKNIYRGKGL